MSKQSVPLKDLLILAYYFPPVHVVGAIRLFHFHHEAKDYFKDVHVLTSSNTQLMRQDASLETHSPNIQSIPTLDLRRFSLYKKKRPSPHVSTTIKQKSIFRWFQKAMDSFPFSLLLADGGLVYIYLSYQKGKKLVREGKISHLFSSFRPQADHIVAHLLKRKFPQLYWIADFRDLPIDPIRNNVFWPKWQARWQHFLLKKANIVTTVSKGLLTHLQRLHHHTYLLPNGIASAPISPQVLPLPTKFTISYTGSLYPELQSPTPLFAALRQLLDDEFISWKNIQLIYAGKDGAYWDQLIQAHQLESINLNKGLVSYAEAQQLQRQTHLNLLLSWSFQASKGILTAKLYDYLAAGRPIIAIVNGERDVEFEELTEKLRAGRNFYSEDQGIDTVISKYVVEEIGKWQKNEDYIAATSTAGFEQFKWRYLFKAMIKHLQ